MSDLNWCTFCDNAISSCSDSLYCSENCLRSDALNHHPLLGYDYAELKDFPRSSPTIVSSASSTHSSISASSTHSSISTSSTISLSPVLSPIALPAFHLSKNKKSPRVYLLSLWNQ